MSLLNDALRAAEQRQGRQDAPAAYTGQSAAMHSSAGRGRLWLTVLALVTALLFAGWWLLSEQRQEAEELATPAVIQGPVVRDAETALSSDATPEPAEAIAEPAEQTAVVPEPIAETRREPLEPAQTPAVAESPEPPPATSAVAVSDTQPAANEARPVAAANAGDANSRPDVAAAETPPDTAGVKQVRETPEVVDRRTSRELDDLLRAGRWAEARQRLGALTGAQAAPLSRHVVARRLLIENQPQQALDLMPEAIAESSAALRLLRARALLATDELESAVATLQVQLPEVADHTEYHVTLATLLHQNGNNEEAARRWAELIAWDDSQAPWWVGLAIALESGGQSGSARRAYEQAAALPGLPPSLAEYVRQRLQSLRAG